MTEPTRSQIEAAKVSGDLRELKTLLNAAIDSGQHDLASEIEAYIIFLLA